MWLDLSCEEHGNPRGGFEVVQLVAVGNKNGKWRGGKIGHAGFVCRVEITHPCSLAIHEVALKLLVLQSANCFSPGADGGGL